MVHRDTCNGIIIDKPYICCGYIWSCDGKTACKYLTITAVADYACRRLCCYSIAASSVYLWNNEVSYGA